MRSLPSSLTLLLVVAASAFVGCGKDVAEGARSEPTGGDVAPGGHPAPPLATDGAWVKGGPIHLDALRGKKAVLVEVGFSSCKRCRATVPHLATWNDTYAAKGLQVIFVNDGSVSPPLEAVQGFVKDLGIQFPVLHDEKGTTAKAYGVSAYPHVFLIDRRGQIVWDGSPVGREAEVDAQIQKVLN